MRCRVSEDCPRQSTLMGPLFCNLFMNSLNKFRGAAQVGIGAVIAGFGCSDPDVCGVEPCEEQSQQLEAGAGGSAGSDSDGGSGGSSGGRRQTAGFGGSVSNSGASGGGAGSGEPRAGAGGGASEQSCSDGELNGNEADVDCGGSCDSLCGDDKDCGQASDCLSGVCSSSICAPASCSDGVLNGDESSKDCGGSCDSQCLIGTTCQVEADCGSSICAGGLCASGACEDGQLNGDETGVDCGGSCAVNCATAQACIVGADCSSGSCIGEQCVAASCDDGVLNGSETGVDCGGICVANCAEGVGCATGADCVSSTCTAGQCGAATVVASCDDTELNGDETGVDCGGSCNSCGRGLACNSVADCSTVGCVDGQCVIGPTAGLVLLTSSGPPPFNVSVTSIAGLGDAAIASTTYQFEEGQGFASATTHTYTAAGSYTVTQRVTDTNGFASEASSSVFVVNVATGGVLFSETDTSNDVFVAPDGLTLEFTTFSTVGARTESAISAGQGFFYYEGERLSEPYFFSIGLVTSNFDLTEDAGNDSQSLAVETTQGVLYDSANLGGFDPDSVDHYGFAVDYRGANPTVYVIADGDLVATVDMSTGAPLYAYAGGLRSIVGPQVRINTGNDTENFPFFYDVAGILSSNGVSPAGLVLGFGATNAAAPSNRPVLNISGSTSVALGGTINLAATASDAEDGNITGNIRWSDRSVPYAERAILVGASAGFDMNTLGVHPIEVTVTDNSGLVATEVVDITVTGTLPQFNPVQLEADSRSGVGIVVSGDGISAKFNNGDKYGIRANQGLLNGYQYFEIERFGPIVNQGGGLVIAGGNLNPYSPIDVPASCSVNYIASIWRNLISLASYDEPSTAFYGFAVDYRGRTPVVHIITENAGGGAELSVSFDLDDVTVPIYPLLYGNPSGNGQANDARMNFTGPFHYAPASVLGNNGVDTSGLQLGWGAVNSN